MIEGVTLATQAALAVSNMRAGRITEATITINGESEVLKEVTNAEGKAEYHIAGVVLDVLTSDAVVRAIRDRDQRI